MFNLSPTHQFLIQKGLQALAGQGQGQPGQQGQMPMPTPSPMLRNAAGMQTPPQSMPGTLNLGNSGGQLNPKTGMANPVGTNSNPGIMNRFRQMMMSRLPPQMSNMGASQMMPPQS